MTIFPTRTPQWRPEHAAGRPAGRLLLAPGASHRTGFTLIEMLIVIAIIAILSVAMGIVVEKSLRGQAELNRRLEMQTGLMSAFAALARDTAGCQSCRILASSDATSTATGELVLLLGQTGAESDARPSSSLSPTPARWVVYQVREGRLVRSVMENDEGVFGDSGQADENKLAEWARRGQTLADRVESFRVKLSGSALSVDLMVEEYHYHRTMHSQGATTFLLPVQDLAPVQRETGGG